jgi:hypothetical protein
MGLKHPFDELESEPAEPVAVGNHNFSDHSLGRELQDGAEAPSLEVDARSDVGDDSVIWERLLHVVDLSLEVVFLILGRDSAIADAFFFPGAAVFSFFALETVFLVVVCGG